MPPGSRVSTWLNPKGQSPVEDTREARIEGTWQTMVLTPESIAETLRILVSRLQGSDVRWAITGSLGFRLQGVPVSVNDIDIQTDRSGAYEIETRLAEFGQRRVRFSVSDRIRSHYGVLDINGVPVEIMGDIEKRLDDQTWDAPPDIEAQRRFVSFQGLTIPVLSLEYECRAYRILGRIEKARMLEEWLAANRDRDKDME